MRIVEQFIERLRCGPTVAARVRRLSANAREGEIIRGYYRKPLSWRRAKARMRRDGTCSDIFRAPWGEIIDPLLSGPCTLAMMMGRRPS